MDSCVLSIKAVPGASRDEIQGWLGEALKVRIQAPPTDGKANAALCSFIAASLGLPRHAVNLVGGNTSRQKRVAIAGLNSAEVRTRLEQAMEKTRHPVKMHQEGSD
jgi:uncharacterized protein (TIGR00251 family)